MADPRKLADLLLNTPVNSLLAPDQNADYGTFLPFAKDRTTGDVRLAMPSALRSGLQGIADLGAATETGSLTGDALASLTMGGLGAGMTAAPRGALAAGGAPIRAYHGTRSKADILSSGFREGSYFTDAPLDALRFADEKWMNPNASKVMRVDLTPKNPYEMDAAGQMFEPALTEQAISAAKAGGHDAAIIRNIVNFEHGEPSTTYIALDPEIIQILRKYGMAAPAPVGIPGKPKDIADYLIGKSAKDMVY